MLIGRIGFLLFIANFLVISLVWLVPESDSAALLFSAGAQLLSSTCSGSGGYWLDDRRALSLALGIPLSAVGVLYLLAFGTYTSEALKRKRNGASVMTACWMAATACVLLSFSFFPCNEFYDDFAEAAGLSANRTGHALRNLLAGSWPIFNAFYACLFCAISWTIALGLKLLIRTPGNRLSGQ
ncbi:hypothetical protein [Pseudomonas sp. SCB32]|uniref:hypothetical protein n=1 Tax=Pseudomonas sp. SCB32 TaxID=2653853 RepID=UPI001264A424|nr:hypothetical protein [Pseudomonas sp. SCB32]